MYVPNVLFIEKDFSIKQKWVVLLYGNGFEALPVSNTNEALAMLRVSKFDLVVVARHLPDGDADNLIHTMKAAPALRPIPIVVTANEFSDSERTHYLKTGAEAVISNEQDSQEQIKTLKGLVDLHQNEARQTQTGISGQLAQTPISQLIKELGEEHTNGILYIDGVVPMEIHLVDKQIIHARHGITVGFKALCRCLLIAEAAFHFSKETSSAEPTIKGDLELLLNKAKVSNQKLMANFHRLPNTRHRARIVEADIWENTKLKPEARAALEIIRKYPRVGTYLDRLNLPDVVCHEYLLTFIERGVIELVTESKPVQIMTDASCDLPFEMQQELGIFALPLRLEIGKETYQPYRSTEEKQLYAKKTKVLEQAKIKVPDESAIYQRFEALLPDYDCLIITAASSKVPIFELASNCVEKLQHDGFEGRSLLANELSILDSHAISIGLGLLVHYAANLAKQGLQAEQIEERLLLAMSRLHLFFVVNPEDSYLVKKGNAPVILGWDGNEITIAARLSRGESAVPILVEETAKRIDSKSKLHLGFGDVQNEQGLQQMRAEFAKKFGLVQPVLSPIGPMTGHILGKGALGLAFFQE